MSAFGVVDAAGTVGLPLADFEPVHCKSRSTCTVIRRQGQSESRVARIGFRTD